MASDRISYILLVAIMFILGTTIYRSEPIQRDQPPEMKLQFSGAESVIDLAHDAATTVSIDYRSASDAFYAEHQPCATPSYMPEQCGENAHMIWSGSKGCWVCAPDGGATCYSSSRWAD